MYSFLYFLLLFLLESNWGLFYEILFSNILWSSLVVPPLVLVFLLLLLRTSIPGWDTLCLGYLRLHFPLVAPPKTALWKIHQGYQDLQNYFWALPVTRGNPELTFCLPVLACILTLFRASTLEYEIFKLVGAFLLEGVSYLSMANMALNKADVSWTSLLPSLSSPFKVCWYFSALEYDELLFSFVLVNFMPRVSCSLSFPPPRDP